MEKPKHGSRILNAKGVPGTLGCVVRTLHTGLPVLLSTWHVLFGDHADADSPVFLDKFGYGFSGVGRTLYGKCGNVGYAGRSYYVDCAVASYQAPVTDHEKKEPAWPLGICGSVEPGSRVTKAGAASGVTHGMVVDANYSDTILLNGRECLAERQLLVHSCDHGAPFAMEGDSGALVVDASQHAVGLLWGTRANGEAVVTPIAPILFALNIAIACPA
jgi:hypothetical protein